MPWSRKQNKLFCARCKDGSGDADMCRMCREGVTADGKTPKKKGGIRRPSERMKGER